jgi:NADH dehydrogenase/NADH:ubiquinone oxidoreductase subunit G
MVAITINGKKLSVQEETTILEAALQNNIYHRNCSRQGKPF